jgi:hypothetical protein
MRCALFDDTLRLPAPLPQLGLAAIRCLQFAEATRPLPGQNMLPQPDQTPRIEVGGVVRS